MAIFGNEGKKVILGGATLEVDQPSLLFDLHWRRQCGSNEHNCCIIAYGGWPFEKIHTPEYELVGICGSGIFLFLFWGFNQQAEAR